MPVCYISLGGNLGPVEQTFDSVIDALRDEPRVWVERVSSYHRTDSVGDNAGGDFLNAVLALSTKLAPLDLLKLLQEIESSHGRMREAHWGPRTLDLDMLFYGPHRVEMPPILFVPHPHCWYRRFVLDPLAEIAPDFVHPVIGKTIAVLRESLLQRPFLVGLAAKTEAEIQQLEEIIREFPDVEPVKNRVPALHSATFRDAILEITLENGVASIIGPQFLGATVPDAHRVPVDSYIRNTLRAALGR